MMGTGIKPQCEWCGTLDNIEPGVPLCTKCEAEDQPVGAMTNEHKARPPYFLTTTGKSLFLMNNASQCLAEIYDEDDADFILKAISCHNKPTKDREQLFDALGGKMDKKMPTIICLCGSTRFWEAFADAAWAATLEGMIVLSVGECRHVDAEGGHGAEMLGPEVVEKLDELHLRKIDLCDVVMVLNVDGYIGESTRKEIEYAKRMNKPIRYLEPIAPGAKAISGHENSM